MHTVPIDRELDVLLKNRTAIEQLNAANLLCTAALRQMQILTRGSLTRRPSERTMRSCSTTRSKAL